tara:strand:+ start:12358 stop:13107 length:750 start_codon:yes stop_codon:yes gene_type:complete
MRIVMGLSLIVSLFQLNMCASSSSNTGIKKAGSASSAQHNSTSKKVGKAPKKQLAKTPSSIPDDATLKAKGLKRATFAAGCFWCIQPPFDKLPGVVYTFVGYAGGKKKNPTYREVAYGKTTHLESIHVIYDPKKVSYKRILEVFWTNIDPTDPKGQFVDKGPHYRSAIFYYGQQQRQLAEASKKQIASSKRFSRPIVTMIRKAGPFYMDKTYHQKYYISHPYRYKRYRRGSGRDAFIQRHWVSPVFRIK